jgi:hypothetical protein
LGRAIIGKTAVRVRVRLRLRVVLVICQPIAQSTNIHAQSDVHDCAKQNHNIKIQPRRRPLLRLPPHDARDWDVSPFTLEWSPAD